MFEALFEIIPLYQLLLIAHIVGVVFGLGGATVSDVLFMTALQDDEVIDEKEETLLKRASLVIWAGIALLVISGFWMFWLNREYLMTQPRHFMHTTLAMVVIANGFFVNFWILPRLAGTSRQKEQDESQLPAYLKYRSIGFISGAVSFSTWWLVLLLGMARRIDFPDWTYVQMLLAYLFIEVVAIAGATALGNMTWKRYQKHAAKG